MVLLVGDRVRVRAHGFDTGVSESDYDATVMSDTDEDGHIEVEFWSEKEQVNAEWFVLTDTNATEASYMYRGYGKVLRKLKR
jgi:hypothetical protein